tara:strand:+ start:516 stop:698 length:183 start_codon:yes stop_codon:yes gene_type:complete
MTTIAELKEEIDKIKLQIKTIKKNVNSKQVLEIEVKVDGFPTDLERLKMLNTIFSAKNKQ